MRSDLQSAGVIEFVDCKGFAQELRRTLFECSTRLASHPRRPGIGLGAVQQGLGIAVELGEGNAGGEHEKTAQAIKTLHLILEAFFDTAVTLTGQQFETLPQLLAVQVMGRQRQQRCQQAAGHKRHPGHQPGGNLFADKAEHLRTSGVHRHRKHSKRQRPADRRL
ncbi:hypothetical protein D3C80_988650 [compost metagenome]